MKETYFISDAAKEVKVESHVLRYWEEELNLPIKRNELGHRYYTKEDVELFCKVKDLKERGLQLKAIKTIMEDGKLESGKTESGKTENREVNWEGENHGMGIMILESHDVNPSAKEEKAKRIQNLLRQIIQETVRESSREICREIKESVLKELDYQFRIQEERLEEREELRMQRSEEYYRRMDELLREKSGRDESKRGAKRILRRIFWRNPKEHEEHVVKKEKAE